MTLSHLSADEVSNRLGSFSAQVAGPDATGNGNRLEWPKIGVPPSPAVGHSSDQTNALLYQMRAGALPPAPAEAGVPKPVCLSRTRTTYGTAPADAQASSQQDWPAAATSTAVGEQMGYLPLPSPRRETSNGLMSFSTQVVMSDALGASHVAQPGGVVQSMEAIGHRVVPPQQRVLPSGSLPLAPVPERTVLHRHGTAPAPLVARQSTGVPMQPRSLHPEFATNSQAEVTDRPVMPIPQAVAMTHRAAPPATIVRGETFTTRQSLPPAPRPALVQRAASFAHGGTPTMTAHGGTPTMTVRRTLAVSENSNSHVGLVPRADGSVRYVATSAAPGVLPRTDSHAVPVYRVQTFSGRTMLTGQSFAYPASGSFAYGGPVGTPLRSSRPGEINVAEDIDYVTRVNNMRRAVHESYGW